MKRLHVIILAAIVSAAACKSGGKSSKVEVSGSDKNTAVAVEAVKEEMPSFTFETVAGTIDFQDMDPKIDPRKDFYSFANGNWVRNNPVPATENRWSSFNILSDDNNRKLRAILEEAAAGKYPKGDHRQLIGDYYASFMDSAKRDKEGIAPIQTDLKKIDAIKSKKELAAVIAHHHNYGIHPLFDTGIDQDLKDINRHMAYISQSGLLLPNKDYYFKSDSSSVKLRNNYIAHLSRMFVFLGYDKTKADKAAASVLDLETQLAEASMGPVEMRNIEAQYNKMSIADFKKSVPSFDWNKYFNDRGLAKADTIIVGQPAFFKRVEAMITSVSLDVWKDYLKIHFFEAASGKLSSEIEQEVFSFFSTQLRGTKKMKPRWERAINSIGWTAIGEALGHAFVDKHFKPESKLKVNEMVDNIMFVFRGRLDKLEWMSPVTKTKALEKLASFTRKLGYPDKWTDYSTLSITRESYFKNWMEQSKFKVTENTQKLGKPIDRSEWQMAPHIVNAYYNPTWNEIVFPAGIMQPPFFDPNAEDAVNYARMGAVIGHEFLHGFDDQGAQFDATGQFVNWWTSDDSLKFAARTNKLVEHFNSFEALPGIFVNGELTLGENIADLGGLTMSYYAYQRSLEGKERKKINGFTAEQRFFVAFAQVWKENHTESSMKLQVFTNPHSPGKYRVLGPLANMPEFFQAFNVKEGDPMRRAADKISLIW
ncbi:MAG TPA: M13 family metallopeptidase [Flavobacteriales bacterium]|nr:M13 family metallopeptidase [Flavobacteriales bacterium]HRJ35701.1 M13 family metallopeptidase [Flavobacteriales bacterium]HRJ38233.1 M13 family metallopeptidase [Flavobacteriales bacterium]